MALFRKGSDGAKQGKAQALASVVKAEALKEHKDGTDWRFITLVRPDEGRPFDRTKLKTGSTDPDAPLYENHCPSAQLVWTQLHEKQVFKETTSQEPDGRQVHVELGEAEEGIYLYCANTFDQRQLVIVEPARKGMLESYYKEITSLPL